MTDEFGGVFGSEDAIIAAEREIPPTAPEIHSSFRSEAYVILVGIISLPGTIQQANKFEKY